MFTNIISPRFLETDALGHINNTVPPMWFEASRVGIFNLFSPTMDIRDWKLIIASFSVDFHAETHFGTDVEIRTFISRVGTSSFDVYQECWQNGGKTVSGTAIMVHFCHKTKKSQPLPSDVVEQLNLHRTPE